MYRTYSYSNLQNERLQTIREKWSNRSILPPDNRCLLSGHVMSFHVLSNTRALASAVRVLLLRFSRQYSNLRVRVHVKSNAAPRRATPRPLSPILISSHLLSSHLISSRECAVSRDLSTAQHSMRLSTRFRTIRQSIATALCKEQQRLQIETSDFALKPRGVTITDRQCG